MLRFTPTVARLLPATLVGVLCALVVRSHALSAPSFISDFDQVLAAARALVNGADPYTSVGPDAPFQWRWPLYYPMPAVLVATPLTLVSVTTARMLFAGLSATCFTYAISRDGWSRWPILLSVTFYVSVDLVQWSPLIASAYFLPLATALIACKPNFGLAVAATADSERTWWWMAAGAALLLFGSFVARPGWLGEWIATVRSAPHFAAPVTRDSGVLLLLAALRWRRPEARWLLALSMTPQAPSFYDQLLLVVVCQRWWDTALLSASTYVLYFYVGTHSPTPDYETWGRLVGNATVWFCYLPLLAIVLARRNEGNLPWVVRFISARRTSVDPET